VRIGEWHDGIVSAYGQPLLKRHAVVRGRLGPVDMELLWFHLQQLRFHLRHLRFLQQHYRELFCVGVCATCSSAHGGNFGKPDQHNRWQSLGRDLVLDHCDLMHRLGQLDGGESYQRHPCGIADKHRDLHADLHRDRRHVLGQYDGGGVCTGTNSDSDTDTDTNTDTNTDTTTSSSTNTHTYTTTRIC